MINLHAKKSINKIVNTFIIVLLMNIANNFLINAHGSKLTFQKYYFVVHVYVNWKLVSHECYLQFAMYLEGC